MQVGQGYTIERSVRRVKVVSAPEAAKAAATGLAALTLYVIAWALTGAALVLGVGLGIKALAFIGVIGG